jgi:hypothetical protein
VKFFRVSLYRLCICPTIARSVILFHISYYPQQVILGTEQSDMDEDKFPMNVDGDEHDDHMYGRKNK